MSSITYWMLALGISSVYSVNISDPKSNQVSHNMKKKSPAGV